MVTVAGVRVCAVEVGVSVGITVGKEVVGTSVEGKDMLVGGVKGSGIIEDEEELFVAALSSASASPRTTGDKCS